MITSELIQQLEFAIEQLRKLDPTAPIRYITASEEGSEGYRLDDNALICFSANQELHQKEKVVLFDVCFPNHEVVDMDDIEEDPKF